MKTIITSLCYLIMQAPKKLIMYTLLCACVFSSLLFVAKIDLSFYTLLHDKHPLIARYITLNTDLQLAKRLYVVVHDTTEEATTIPQILEDMRKMKDLQSVEVFPYDWIRESSPWIIDREKFNTIENLSHLSLTDTLLEFQQKQAEMIEHNADTLFASPHTHLLLATLTEDPMNQPMGQSSMKEVQEALKDLETKYSVTIEYTGLPAISYEDQSKTLNRISWLSPISLLLVLLIVWKIERRPIYLFAIAVVMLISMTSTLGIVSVIAQKLTILETVFGIMIFGLGVDFAVHLQSRFRQEMHNISSDIEWTERVDQAISKTLHTAGYSVVMGAGTTIGAFAIISTAPDPEAFHLGLSGAIGLFVCVLCMLIIVPSVWKLYAMEKNSNSEYTTYTSYTWIRNTAYISVRYPKTCLTISVICLLSAMTQFSKLHIETDLEKIFNRDIPALTVNDTLEKEFHVHFNPWVLSASNLSELQEKHQQCSQLDFVGRVESFASFIPPDQEERLEQLNLHKNERQTQLQQVHSLIAMNSLRMPNNDARDMESLVQWAQILEILEEAHNTIPTIETTPKFFRDNLQLPDNRLLLFVYPKHASMDGKILQEQRLALEKIDPNVAGLGTAIEGVLFTERPWLWSTSIAILLFLVGYIAMDIKKSRYIILTLLPVLFGSAYTLGILCATDIDCSPITLLAIPLLLGLGIDDGIHVVHKILENTAEPLEQSISSIGQAILFTTITSCASFAVLLCTDHPGMESLGLVLLIGLPCCFIASITIVPAAHQLLLTKQNP